MGDAFLFFLLVIVAAFVLIAVHECGHYLAGLAGGIPAKSMRIVLFAFPQHVAVRDEDGWVSPVKDIRRFVAAAARHLRSRPAAFAWVAGGMTLELCFTAGLGFALAAAGWRSRAYFLACLSLGMFLGNVLLMDLPLAVKHRTAAGDTSGLWQIAPGWAVLFSLAMLGARVLLVVAFA